MTDSRFLTEDQRIHAARAHWRYRGRERPDFAEPPGEGQVSVWDFPRPPVMQACEQPLRASVGGKRVAATDRGVRVLETAGAPTYYFPPDAVDLAELTFVDQWSMCEWKGLAQQIDIDRVEARSRIENAGWSYRRVFEEFFELVDWISFYPARVDCFVGDEQARPQPGGYYGGWVTDELAGPIKGGPGSGGW